MTINDFITAFIEGNLNVLLLSGKADELTLRRHLNSILVEYHDLIGSIESKTLLMLQKRINGTRARVTQIITITHVWIKNRRPELKQILSDFGFHFPSSYSDKMVIDELNAHVKNWLVDIEMDQQDLDNYISRNKSGDTITRNTFVENIILLKREGFNIEINTTRLDEYAISICQLNQIITAKEKAHAKY